MEGAADAHEALKSVRRASLLLAVIIVAATAVIMVSIHNGQIAGCERGKVNAAVLARQAKSRVLYLDRVLAASSVRADVKAAATAHRHEEIVAAGLFRKRSHLDCGNAYPLVSI